MFRINAGIMAFVAMAAGSAPLVSCFSEPQSELEVDIDVAGSVPLEKRLDLYQRIYNQPGHPADSSLSFAFEAEGDAGFRAAVNRMTSVHDFYGMIWIVVAIDRGGGINACAPPASEALRERIKALQMQGRDLSYVTFRECTLQSVLSK